MQTAPEVISLGQPLAPHNPFYDWPKGDPLAYSLTAMSDSELAVVVAPQTFPTPILIERAGPSTRKKFFEFFTVPIRNANTRAAYYRAIQQFLAWVERAGYQDLEDIEPITVAAYIENPSTPGRAAHGQTAYGRHPDAVFLAHRKRSAGHESRPGSQDREIFADRRENPCVRRRRGSEAS